ncbi:MAG: formate/nitrite transporter family protein [Nitrospiraceae bacterium]
MHTADHERITQAAVKKISYLQRSLPGYLILSAFAGIYLGFSIALIFSVGAPFVAAASPAAKLVMGASFGIALTLVIFAGAELFTGNNMVGAIGGLSGGIGWMDVVLFNFWSWAGNLLGSLGLAWLVAQSGVISKPPQLDVILKVATMKMGLSEWELFLRGILCNWLICLAVWTSGRTSNDAAKILLIFWCLFAFIGTGFEHSVANQSFLGMALFLPHGTEVSWGGFWYNQFYVVLGNIVGGGVFVGALYWLVSPYRVASAQTGVAQQPASSAARS